MNKLLKISLSASLILALAPATLAGTHTDKGKTHAAAPKTKDIVATALEAGSFKTLAQALTAAELVETLQGAGPFTVFAPTDAAFAKVPKATLDALLKDKAALKKVLLYHVVSGNVMAKDVVKLKSAKTVQGSTVAIGVNGKTVKINNATVTAADVKASNGVIHVIDTVLLPPQ
jgi:uncharacterized surface protein with fasciclin (FAS1) repeats